MPLDRRELERFMNLCRVRLTGASDAGIKMEFYETVKEFLTESNSWLEHIHLQVVSGTQEYQLVPLEGGQIIRLGSVLDGLQIPVGCVMNTLGTLTVIPSVQVTSVAYNPNDTTLGQTKPWTVIVIKTVTLPTTRDDYPVVPSFVLDVFSKALMDGVVGHMMMQASKSWSNAAGAAYYLKSFEDGKNMARNMAIHGNILGGQRWAFPRTAGRGTQRGRVTTAFPSQVF